VSLGKEIKDLMVVSAASDWFVFIYGQDYYNKNEDEISDSKEYEIVSNIIALQISILALRRLAYICGSLIDSLEVLENKEILNYEKEFNKKYIDPNENIDY
jgi:hypothetical protein